MKTILKPPSRSGDSIRFRHWHRHISRADTAYTNTTDYGYFDGANAILTGDEDELSDVVTDDVFKATVTVIGAFDLDTQIGGNTTVPHLTVDKLKVIGNNG